MGGSGLHGGARVLCTGAPEDHDVQERVGAQAVGAVDGRAGGLACGHEAWDDFVRVGGGGGKDLAIVVGGDASHVVVDGWEDWNGFLGGGDVLKVEL